MRIIEKENSVILENQDSFTPKHIFECGQCFRWDVEEDDSYTIVAYDKVINVSREGRNVVLKNTNLQDYENIWKYYFDLETNYNSIKSLLKLMDQYLEVSTQFGEGIRILNQDFHEMIISFIISARNSIPMIKRSIQKLSEMFGEKIQTYNGKDYYTFPKLENLAKASEEEIKEAKVAFRAKYIKTTAQMILENGYTKEEFVNMDTLTASKKLQELQGVGPKVSQCILLFGLHKMDTFPVDVWVKRVMEEFYLKDEKMSLDKINKYALDKFGYLSGYAQQYLFYYAREKGIGK